MAEPAASAPAAHHDFLCCGGRCPRPLLPSPVVRHGMGQWPLRPKNSTCGQRAALVLQLRRHTARSRILINALHRAECATGNDRCCNGLKAPPAINPAVGLKRPREQLAHHPGSERGMCPPVASMLIAVTSPARSQTGTSRRPTGPHSAQPQRASAWSRAVARSVSAIRSDFHSLVNDAPSKPGIKHLGGAQRGF